MKRSQCALAAVLAALGLSAWAQVGNGPVPQLAAPATIYSSSPPSMAVRRATFAPAAVAGAGRLSADAREERRFLRDAAAQSRFELDASRHAFDKSGNSAVRSLAASLINHNNTASLELAHLLHARGMALPMISNAQRKALNRLARLSGARLDAAYLHEVGLAQAGVARDYERAKQAIRDPQLNAWIARNLPTTRYHLMLAERAVPQLQAGKWNRAGIKPDLVKAPAPAPVSMPPAARAGVQPVRATLGQGPEQARGFSGSGIR